MFTACCIKYPDQTYAVYVGVVYIEELWHLSFPFTFLNIYSIVIYSRLSFEKQGKFRITVLSTCYYYKTSF